MTTKTLKLTQIDTSTGWITWTAWSTTIEVWSITESSSKPPY